MSDWHLSNLTEEFRDEERRWAAGRYDDAPIDGQLSLDELQTDAGEDKPYDPSTAEIPF